MPEANGKTPTRALLHRHDSREFGVRIKGVGTANPSTSYSQSDVLDFFQVQDRRTRSVFLNSAIVRRNLTLPLLGDDGLPRPESQADLLRKHRVSALEMGAQAIIRATKFANTSLGDIGYLCCVTTTGFMAPGLSALLTKELGLSSRCGRLDVVGMGCNAGLNAMNAVANWSRSNPGVPSILLCVEVCSAGYVIDGTMRSAVVNSLFGDGAGALVLEGSCQRPSDRLEPEILQFHSHIITDAIDEMRYEWDEDLQKFNFFLAPDVPYIIGANVSQVVSDLLADTGLRQSDIKHWLVHSGGKKVIDAVKVNLGLAPHDLRHTISVLRDHGNLSSGSYLFSYSRLLTEGVARKGDFGVMMTMGPGTTVEAALLKW